MIAHLNNLNTQLQGRDKIMSEQLQSIHEFQLKTTEQWCHQPSVLIERNSNYNVQNPSIEIMMTFEHTFERSYLMALQKKNTSEKKDPFYIKKINKLYTSLPINIKLKNL
ncbi:uncharacterized protein LOC143222935 [Tachypleus tridentatus]|uniref:uncharacterized protein LOC143222935 n=1 Tax=Tachypleus tridentatus TaxID=6853 RepID=UPI003FD64E96